MITDKKALLELYEFRVATRNDFDKTTDLPEGLLTRADEHKGEWVIYDPIDDCDGFLLIGDDLEALLTEAVEFLELSKVE